MTSRYLIYGVTGSGKSTLAAALGERTGLPAHFVDDEIGWLPGWVNRSESEQRIIAEGICAGDSWILDSAYATWRDIVLVRAQLIVALDYPRWLSLAQLIRRTARRAATRERVCNDNVESVRQMISRDSIIVWHFKSFARKRATIRGWGDSVDGIPVVRLTSRRATREWLAALEV